MNYRLEIESFGCISDLNVDLSTGLNYVYGEHGSGKSTFLRALQTTLFGKAFGGKHKQMGKAGCHQISLQNHVFDVTQGHNERDGKFFRGDINGQKLEGEYAENREKFLRHFDVTPKTAWDVLTSRLLFYYHTPTLWAKTDTEMVSYLTKALGQDVQRIQVAHDKIKKDAKTLKDKIATLELESKNSSGLELASTAEYDQKIAELKLTVAGTFEPYMLITEEPRLVGFERELKNLESSHTFYLNSNKKQTDDLEAKLTNKEFDEKTVRERRDALIAELADLQKQIKQVRAQVLKPLDCPACHEALLYQDQDLILANKAAIEQAKALLTKLLSQETNLVLEKSSCDDTLAQVELKSRIEKLKTDRQEKEATYQQAHAELVQKIAQLKEKVQKSKDADPTWKEIAKLEQVVRDIQHNNKRYDRFLEIEKELAPLREELARYEFMSSKNGFVLFRNQEFLQQASQYSKLINEVLSDLNEGKIEFEPTYADDGSVIGVSAFHCNKKGEWFDYDQLEASLQTILDFAAFLVQRKLNPHGIDALELLLVDDPAHLSDSRRIAPLLSYINQLPLVTVLAWSYPIDGLVKPTQVIKLYGEKSFQKSPYL